MSYTVGDQRLPKRFWDKVKIVDCVLRPELGPCWEWTAHITRKGYGMFHVGSKKNHTNRMVLIHTLTYKTLVGPIPDGLEIDHLCRNRACANPNHLEPVTSKVNSQRGLVGKIHNYEKAKIHCPKGHPYDVENTSWKPNGWRQCRTCERERQRLKSEYPKPPNYPNSRKTHCPKGHPYDQTNTYTKPDGRRVCIICRNELKRLAR